MAAPWPSYDVDRARELYEGGMTLDEVCLEVGATPSRLSQALRRRGVEMRPAAPRSNAVPTSTIVRLRDAGGSWQAVADEVGMSVAGVRERYLAAAGRPRRR